MQIITMHRLTCKCRPLIKTKPYIRTIALWDKLLGTKSVSAADAASNVNSIKFAKLVDAGSEYLERNEVEGTVRLKLEALKNQALRGPCKEPKPLVMDLAAKAKWQSWMDLGVMSKDDAMKSYLDMYVQ